MDKDDYIKKLKTEIIKLQQLQQILISKDPPHDFIQPLLGNAVIEMADLTLYLEGKNLYQPVFDEAFFNNRQVSMHRVFFSDLHISTEDGLRKIIKDKKFKVEISRAKQANSIVEKIKSKLPSHSLIESELKKITRLGGNHPTFGDYLNTVLNGIKGLSQEYKNECRIYFDAVSIIRNKVSHSDMTLDENEKTKLKAAKYANAISPTGDLQMTFEGYYPLATDVIRFFDNLYAHMD